MSVFSNVKEEMAKMGEEAVPENTSRATKSGIRKLLDWMKSRNIDINFQSVKAEELASVLRRFYAEVKKENGQALTPSSLVGIRASINRSPLPHFIEILMLYRDPNSSSPTICLPQNVSCIIKQITQSLNINLSLRKRPYKNSVCILESLMKIPLSSRKRYGFFFVTISVGEKEKGGQN